MDFDEDAYENAQAVAGHDFNELDSSCPRPDDI